MSTREIELELIACENGEEAVVTYEILSYPTCATFNPYDGGEPGDSGDWNVIDITYTSIDGVKTTISVDSLCADDRRRIDEAIGEDIPSRAEAAYDARDDYDDEYYERRAVAREYYESKARW